MSWTKYIFVHLLKNWERTWRDNATNWWHLMTGRYDDYVLLDDEIPFEECRLAFWASLNTDWTDSKHELDCLIEQLKQLENGEIDAIELDLFDL